MVHLTRTFMSISPFSRRPAQRYQKLRNFKPSGVHRGSSEVAAAFAPLLPNCISTLRVLALSIHSSHPSFQSLARGFEGRIVSSLPLLVSSVSLSPGRTLFSPWPFPIHAGPVSTSLALSSLLPLDCFSEQLCSAAPPG